MFREIHTKFNKSLKNKADIFDFWENTYNGIIEEVDGLRDYLRQSIVDRIEINKNSIFVVLNSHFFNIKLQINKDGFKQLPISVLCMGAYEPNEFAIVEKILGSFDKNKDFVFLDIGANLGWYSLFINKMFKKGHVYAQL